MRQVHQVHPVPADIDPLDAHRAIVRPAPEGRPWVLVNMVASLDGAISVDGRSGGLGGPTDLAVFRALRAVPDVILAGAGTVRAERYGPPRVPEEVRRRRVDAGQAAVPRLTVVSGRLDLDPALPLFADRPDDQLPPIVITGAGADPAARDRLEGLAELVVLPTATLDPAAIMAALHDLGAATVLVEGGPGFNGHLLDADLVDELDLTISPLLVGGTSQRAVTLDHEAVRRFDLGHVWVGDDGVLCTRYVRPGT